jgi:ABC-type Fe3+ transport system substrate-binding protein
MVSLLWGQEALSTEKLVIISPHWEGIRREFAQAFEEYYRKEKNKEVVVEWLGVGASSNILLYIRSEFSSHPESIGVDLVWGGGSIYYQALKDDGLLEPMKLDKDIMAAIPAQAAGTRIYDPKRQWFGTALSSFGILYNKEVIDILGLPEPSSWKDLASPVFHDWVVLADPRHSGTSHALLEIMLQAYGWDEGFSVLTSCFANSRTITKASSQIPVLVATGEAAIGPAIDFYAWAKIQEVGEGRLGFALPMSESIVNIDPIAQLKGAPSPRLAKAFIEFVLSKKGQRLWMLPPGDPDGPKKFILARLSVIPGLYPELGDRTIVKTNPFEMEHGIDFDEDLAAQRWQTLNDLVGVAMIDAHKELMAGFSAIKDQDSESSAFRRLVAPPESEEIFLSRSDMWSDPAYRNEIISSWAEFSRIKYKGVLKIAGDGERPIYDSLSRVAKYIFPVLILGLMLEVMGLTIFRQIRRIYRSKGDQDS